MKKLITIILAFFILTLFHSIAHAKRKSYWVSGMNIGAGVGAISGFVGGIVVSPACEENQGECLLTLPIVLSGVGAIGGATIGSLIGLAIPKKSKVSASPLISTSPNGNLIGGGLAITGNF